VNQISTIFYINPAIRLVDFGIGIFIFAVFERVKEKQITLSYTLLEYASLLLLVMFLAFHHYIPHVFRYSFYYWLPMSFIVLIFAFQGGSLSSVLSKKIFALLGELSFGFYMFHLLVMRYFIVINVKFLHLQNAFLIVCLVFLTTLLLSYGSLVFVERPAIDYSRRKIRS
jgi:peptidoglycan/LPS O-acetylase OafA/YrhL